MKKRITKLLLLALPCFFATAKAEINQFAVSVGEFDKLKVADNVNVIYSCNPDSIGYACFECENELADAFIFTNKKGTLKIQVATDFSDNDNLPTIRVYSKFLNEAENSAEQTTHIQNLAPCSKFKAKIIGNGKLIVDNLNSTKVESKIETGNGTIVLSGECNDAHFNMVGTGVIQADGLKSKESYCSIFGTGSIGCWVTDLLKVSGIGSTKIYYKGNPHTIKKAGGGNLISLESEE